MRGSFRSDRFRFEVARTRVDLGRKGERQHLVDDLGYRLVRGGLLPDLGGTPVASWLLARLGHLTAGGIPLFGEEKNDGGGYSIEFIVHEEAETRAVESPSQGTFGWDLGPRPAPAETPVAEFQLQGDSNGVGIVGECVPYCPCGEILQALASALLAEPGGLVPCRMRVYDPEWEEDPEEFTPTPDESSRNDYGWDGWEFLGASNIGDRL